MQKHAKSKIHERRAGRVRQKIRAKRKLKLKNAINIFIVSTDRLPGWHKPQNLFWRFQCELIQHHPQHR